MAEAGRNIILLSDGTGNAAGKLFKTNVWRVYDALDLSNASQIAAYDDGVGTSSIKPLAILGGAVGWGLKRNVLSLYTFLCGNYQPGDCIYGFGFSRGAFTMRVLIDFVLTQGLVADATSSDDLRRKALRLYRKFRIEKTEYYGLHSLARPLRDALVFANDSIFGRRAELKDIATTEIPEIEFLGLWDTVDAYGLPVAELGKGVDQWIWPLSLGDKTLNPKIRKACHALALDDRRETFHPLLWDESTMTACEHTDAERLTQVWFVGAHANVGGGYPDDALSFVPLRWMIGEATKRGLRFNSLAIEAFDAKVSPYGRLYNARAGFGAYYRYDPRRLDPPQDRQGACIPDPKIHETVVWRMAMGTDAYAPLSLPNGVRVVTESLPAPVDGTPIRPNILAFDAYRAAVESEGDLYGAPAGRNADPERRKRAAADFAALTVPDDHTLDLIWDTVWWRRVAYFATLVSTALLLAYPAIPKSTAQNPSEGSWLSALGAFGDFVGLVVTIVGWFIDWLNEMAPHAGVAGDWVATSVTRIVGILRRFLPDIASPWIDAFAARPLFVSMLVAAPVSFVLWGALLDRRIHDRALAAWTRTGRLNRIRAFRESLRGRYGAAGLLIGPGVGVVTLLIVTAIITEDTNFFLLASAVSMLILLLVIATGIWWLVLWLVARKSAQSQIEVRGPALWLANVLRTSVVTAVPYRLFARHVLPTVFAFALVIAGMIVLTRVGLDFAQSGGFVCGGGGNYVPQEGVLYSIKISAACGDAGATLEGKVKYRIEISDAMNWTDNGIEVFPFGTSSLAIGWRKVLQLPLRRKLNSPWFALIARIGETGDEDYVLMPNKGYVVTSAEFEITPTKTGNLYLYVNDSVIPVPGYYDRFYRDNAGEMTVKVIRLAPEPKP